MAIKRDPFRYGVALMAVVVTVLILISAYFADRQGGDDEIGLYNPTYMDLHYGKMTYPVYGFYDSMPVHPPIHYKLIAAFMRAGMTLYYAQATPTVLLLLLCVWLIFGSRFSSPVKIGFLFGLWLSYSFFSKPGADLFGKEFVGDRWVLELFGMRPEGDLGAGWLAGLLALESGRQANWSLPKEFLGALLLTYAASLHYYATAAVLGCVVYAGCAVFELGWGRAKRVVGVIAAGCLIYGLLELILWVIPQRADILYMIRGSGTPEGLAAVIREHVALYHYWASRGAGFSWLRLPFSLGLPVVLISTPILLGMRQTRVLCLAALPLQLFVLLLAWHKHVYYLIHETALYAAAVVAAALAILGFIVRTLPSNAAKQAICLAAVGCLGLSFWEPADFRGTALSWKARIHEQEIARAAAREILGSKAHVASRLGIWYASGAADWYNVAPKLLWPSKVTPEDAVGYLSSFDAVAESMHMSYATSNLDHKALLSWYLDGTLNLRGFFFAQADNALSYLLLQSNPTPPIGGFGLKEDRLLRFSEKARGDYELVVAAGSDNELRNAWSQSALLHNAMPLPDPRPGVDDWLLAAIFPLRGPKAYREIPGFRTIQRVPLAMSVIDKYALVAKLRREDRPIRFHPSNVPARDDYLGGASDIEQSGFGDPPPAGSMALTKIIRLEELAAASKDSNVQSGAGALVITGSGMGAYAATEPIHDSSRVKVPCWIEIRAKVLKGRVGFGLFNRRTGDFVTGTAMLGETRGKTLDLYLAAPSLEEAGDFIVRSEKTMGRSQVLLERVTVWVRKEDWDRQRTLLESSR